MTPPPAPEPEPVDDYDRDARTRQGKPDAMRCRLRNGARVQRGRFLYCPTCDHQLPTPRKD